MKHFILKQGIIKAVQYKGKITKELKKVVGEHRVIDLYVSIKKGYIEKNEWVTEGATGINIYSDGAFKKYFKRVGR